MKVNVTLSIGYPSAQHEDVLELDDNVTDAEIDQEVQDWANNYIEIDWSKENEK